MKRIEFKNIISPNGRSIITDENRWRVIIGSKTEISFKNQKYAIAFQARINEELNDALFTFNDVSMELYRHYKTNWFYFNMNREQVDNEKQIRYAFSEVERLMDKVVIEYEPGRMFAHIKNTSAYLKTIAKCLQSLQRHREAYAEVRSLELLIGRVNNCFEIVDGLGWNPFPPGGAIVRCEPMQQLTVREQLKTLQETLHKRSLRD